MNNGKLNVLAGGDGLDSNGSIVFNGGSTYVEGSSQNNNSPLDSAEERENSSDHGVIINYGEVLAVGSSGMLESPLESSEQNSLVLVPSTSFYANNTIRIVDENDEELFNYKVTKTLKALIASSSRFEIGKKYKVYSNDKLVKEVTLNSKITTSGTIINRPGPR